MIKNKLELDFVKSIKINKIHKSEEKKQTSFFKIKIHDNLFSNAS